MTQHKHIQDWSMTQQNKLITENIAKKFSSTTIENAKIIQPTKNR